MTAEQRADQIATQVADAVRRVVTEAESRAVEIVREAEADAARIRERAETEAAQIRERGEAEARDQIEAARRALDELGGSLATAVSEATPGGETPPAEPETPVSPPAPEQEETAVQPPPATGNGDDAAQRLVAMKLAVDGKDRAEIETELTEKFGDADRSALLDDVLSRVPR